MARLCVVQQDPEKAGFCCCRNNALDGFVGRRKEGEVVGAEPLELIDQLVGETGRELAEARQLRRGVEHLCQCGRRRARCGGGWSTGE